MTRILDVYLNKACVGKLEQIKSGELTFLYDDSYLDSAPHGISLSLPLREEPFTGGQVKAFFSGLLPEGSVRDRLAKYLGLSEKNAFALLEAIGGDCAGALALYPEGEKLGENFDDVELLDQNRLKDILALIKRRPMLVGEEGYRLSLAGAQDKLAVGFRDGHVMLMKGGAPTTHILKPLVDGIKDSAHNELFCMKLAKMIGIDVPEASLHFVDETPYYLVKRYDRHVGEDGVVTRIHQEDFCQALGLAPEIKYEREGGPTIAACQDLIRKHTARPARDMLKLLNIVLFNYLIGNSDAHGKNFSLLYKGAKPELAPAYDLLSTAIYPDLAEKMAMKIGGKYKPKEVYARHFHKLVADTKAAKLAMDKQLSVMQKTIMDAFPSIEESLRRDGVVSDTFEDIAQIIKVRSKRFIN